jgi:hypothetical protein
MCSPAWEMNGSGRILRVNAGDGFRLPRRRWRPVCAGRRRGWQAVQGRATHKALPFIGLQRTLAGDARIPREVRRRAQLCTGRGLRWASTGPKAGPRRRRTGLGRASGSAQSGRFTFFFEIFFSARTNLGNAQKMFRGTKNT